VLGSDAMMDVPPSEATPEAAAPEPSIRRRWLTGQADEAEAEADPEPAPKVKTGGTLFERMSGRAPKVEDDGATAKEPLDIPRFLHRQNNQ
jgi:cell division protein FtsZ